MNEQVTATRNAHAELIRDLRAGGYTDRAALALLEARQDSACVRRRQTGVITWGENDMGSGYLVLRWSSGRDEVVHWPGEPITAFTDSNEVAGAFGYVFHGVSHDGDAVHVCI